MKNLNHEFIKRAEKVTSFNLVSSDFTDLKHKAEIQHLFNKHFFPKFDLNKTVKGVNQNKLNQLIQSLRSENPQMLKALHQYPLKGVGPGEALLYFLIDDGHLGGGSSAGVDLVTTSKNYEVKAVNVTQDGFASNFKLGATFSLAGLMKRTQDLKKGIGGSGSEVNLSEIAKIKERFPREWEAIEEEFRDLTYKNYFRNHEIIFMINTSAARMGNIASVKKVKKDEIFFERITSGTIKPRVKL